MLAIMSSRTKTLIQFLSYLLIVSLFSSCIKDENPDIPAYIYVPSVQFSAGDTVYEGSYRHKFTNAFVSVDGQIIGANHFPILLPAIISDTNTTQRVRVFASIDKNGIASSKAIYPFFDPYEININLQQGKIDTVYAVQRYRSDVQFIKIEDFESAGISFGNNIDAFPNSNLVKQSIDPFEGQYSGQILLDSLNPECYISTSFTFSNVQRPNTASAVFLEFHYKTNLPITVGLIAYRNNGSQEVFIKGGVNSIEGWNKIYFDLTEDIYGLNADRYAVFLRSSLTGTGETEAKVFIDNIKIVHF